MAAAEHVFRLDRPGKAGTMRSHLLQVEKATGIRPAGLDGPPMPDEAVHVFGWFMECCTGRGGNKGLAFSDIKAYCDLTGTVMWPEEVRLLKAFDMTFLRVMNEKGS